MPVIEYLDDVEGFAQEVLDVDMRPEVRIQGRGRQNGTVVEATMVLTHYERGTDVIRECTVMVGEESEEDKISDLQATLNDLVEATKKDLHNRGAIVKAGRWTR